MEENRTIVGESGKASRGEWEKKTGEVATRTVNGNREGSEDGRREKVRKIVERNMTKTGEEGAWELLSAFVFYSRCQYRSSFLSFLASPPFNRLFLSFLAV